MTAGGELVPYAAPIQKYAATFIYVQDFGKYQHSDLESNNIREAHQTLPEIILAFRNSLTRKRKIKLPEVVSPF
jgi:hypothetical protein